MILEIRPDRLGYEQHNADQAIDASTIQARVRGPAGRRPPAKAHSLRALREQLHDARSAQLQTLHDVDGEAIVEVVAIERLESKHEVKCLDVVAVGISALTTCDPEFPARVAFAGITQVTSLPGDGAADITVAWTMTGSVTVTGSINAPRCD